MNEILDAIIEYSAESSPIDYALILSHWDIFLLGAWNTLLLVSLAVVFGAVIAIPLALVRTFSEGPFSKAVGFYVYVFRGTPLLVQAYLIYFGLGQFEFIRESLAWSVLKSAWWCTLIAFILNTVSYQIEIFRGAFRSVPQGQIEAAKALGLPQHMVIRFVILPLGLRQSVPMFLNEIILMVHGSVVASTLTVIDILGAGRWLNGRFYLAYEGFIAASLIYMIVIIALTQVFKRIERNANRHLTLKTT